MAILYSPRGNHSTKFTKVTPKSALRSSPPVVVSWLLFQFHQLLCHLRTVSSNGTLARMENGLAPENGTNRCFMQARSLKCCDLPFSFLFCIASEMSWFLIVLNRPSCRLSVSSTGTSLVTCSMALNGGDQRDCQKLVQRFWAWKCICALGC